MRRKRFSYASHPKFRVSIFANMKYPYTRLAALILALHASSHATVLFQNSADLGANFTTANTSATSTISVLTTLSDPVSGLDGDAIRFRDTNATRLPSLFHQTDVALTGALKVSFDVINFSTTGTNSNFVFRVGPTATGLGAASASSFGIQMAVSGSVIAEQATNATFSSAYTIGERINVTMFYNRSAFTANLTTGFEAPSTTAISLAPNKWALFVDGVEKSSALAEKTTQTYGSSFGFAWLSGTGASGATIDAQFDNIEYSVISVVPEPSSYATLFGLGALGYVTFGRRRRALTV